MDSKTVDRRFYDKKWLSFRDWKKEKNPYFKKEIDIEAKIALKWIKTQIKTGSLLDIGCGGGRNSIFFNKNNFKSFGIDISKEAIQLAKKLNKEEKTKCIFKVKNILDLNYKDNYFNVICDFGCFHHLRKKDYKKYIKNIIKNIKKEGLFVLYTFSLNSLNINKNWIYRNKHYNHYFTLNELKGIFEKKFKIIKHKEISEKNRLLKFHLILMKNY